MMWTQLVSCDSAYETKDPFSPLGIEDWLDFSQALFFQIQIKLNELLIIF
jgi:hypothetical protein